MPLPTTFSTSRLSLTPMALSDNSFIKTLVNTDGWIKFIGNRNIDSLEKANAYIQRILDNPNISYWVVRLKEGEVPVGVVTFIKRDYLQHHDIGFAFLPGHSGCGYAYEAAHEVLTQLAAQYTSSHILATTIPQNSSSIKLLKKLGLEFEKEIEQDKEVLHVYAVAVERLLAKNN